MGIFLRNPLKIGKQKQLFIDDRFIEDMWGLKRTFNSVTRYYANPVLEATLPWEDSGLIAGAVIFDREEKLFKMWYGVYLPISKTDPDAGGTYLPCYAVSKDGIHWEKPLFAELGCKQYKPPTNILFTGEVYANVTTIIKDMRMPEEKRYMAIYLDSGKRIGINFTFSADGIHWAEGKDWLKTDSDSQNTILKDPFTGKWTVFLRPEIYVGHWKRRIARCESEDLVHWTEPSTILLPDELDPPEFYGMPVFLYEGMYLGLLQRYYSSRSSTIDNELAFSRDGIHWDRSPNREAFLSLGVMGEFDSHMVFTFLDPIIVKDKIYFYYAGASGRHNSADCLRKNAIGLATLRLDGFACLDSTDASHMGLTVLTTTIDRKAVWSEEGRMLTKPFILEGDQLYINAETPKGEIKVMVLDAKNYKCPVFGKGEYPGGAFPGFSLDDCVPFTGDSVDHAIKFKNDRKIAGLKGKEVRLLFVIKTGKIYSFQTR